MAFAKKGKAAAAAKKTDETPIAAVESLDPIKERLVNLERFAQQVANTERSTQNLLKKLETAVAAKAQAVPAPCAAPKPPASIIGDPGRWVTLCRDADGGLAKAYDVPGHGVIVNAFGSMVFVPGATITGKEGDLRIEKLP